MSIRLDIARQGCIYLIINIEKNSNILKHYRNSNNMLLNFRIHSLNCHQPLLLILFNTVSRNVIITPLLKRVFSSADVIMSVWAGLSNTDQ